MAHLQSYPSSHSFLSPSSIRNGVVTHPYLHVRDAHDAHVILEAVRQNILPIIRRRLLSSEREEVRSGHVYVWEEAQDEGGLLRWTDGRRWSQSRMRGDYLFYEEKVETTQEERDAKAARRARRASDPNAILPPPTRRKDRPSKPGGLTKQTYSVAVHLPGTTESRKWHLVAYFSGDEFSRLPVIENYDYLRNVQAPRGIFFNSKILTTPLDRFSHFSDESETYEDVVPSNSRHLHRGGSSRSPISPSSSPPLSNPITSPRQHHFPQPYAHEVTDRVHLPPLHGFGATGIRLSLPAPHRVGPSSYAPLSSEDRKVLDSFRVVL